MLEKQGSPQKAVVVCPFLKRGDADARPAEYRLAEAAGLAEAIQLEVILQRAVPLDRIRPSHYLGQGVLDEIKPVIADGDVQLVVIDTALTPVQQRNLERLLECKVIDRTGLILEIFGARAQTREGQLQVELAALTYQRSRLVRSWTHLERQRGGFGFLGGPGESQIEIDRRLIDDRIARIRRELEQVTRTRGLHRHARAKVPFPVVALVGYTNAGKSTLFNTLTRAGVLARDMLFATLDPTMRGLNLPDGQRVILSDTVGFISHLPTTLVAAFRATLEEVRAADLILHVRDITHPETEQQKTDVLAVLAEMGLADDDIARRLLEVWNKADALPEDAHTALAGQAEREDAVLVSAVTGEGLPALQQAIGAYLSAGWVNTRVCLPYSDGQALAWLYEHGKVLERTDDPEGMQIACALPRPALERFSQRFPGVLGNS
jgi:GTP-binding protein HflX